MKIESSLKSLYVALSLFASNTAVNADTRTNEIIEVLYPKGRADYIASITDAKLVIMTSGLAGKVIHVSLINDEFGKETLLNYYEITNDGRQDLIVHIPFMIVEGKYRMKVAAADGYSEEAKAQIHIEGAIYEPSKHDTFQPGDLCAVRWFYDSGNVGLTCYVWLYQEQTQKALLVGKPTSDALEFTFVLPQDLTPGPYHVHISGGPITLFTAESEEFTVKQKPR